MAGKLEVDLFCRDIEHAYNDAIDDAALTSAEQPIFEELFDAVVWFSPQPQETWEYPGYKTEAEIRVAAERAAEKLGRLES